MLCFRYDSQHSLLAMPFLPWKQSLGCDTSYPQELFKFFEDILGRVWLMLNRWVVSRNKYKVYPIPVSLHRNNYSFLRLFSRKKNAEVSLFLHSPPQCCRSMKSTLLSFLTESWTQAQCFGLLLPLTPWEAAIEISTSSAPYMPNSTVHPFSYSCSYPLVSLK